MSIEIIIKLGEGETFDHKLRTFFPSVFGGALAPYAGEAVPLPTTLHERVAAEPTTINETAAQTPKPRGRPRKAEAETPAPQFTVRRYGGREEDTFADSGAAAGCLIEMIQLAHDIEALDSVVAVNAAELLTWPQERQVDVADAIDAARAQIAAGEPEPPADEVQVRYPGPHVCVDKTTPLTVLAVSKDDARNAVQALLTAGGRGAFNDINAKFAELGMKSVSALDDADQRHAAIIQWAAPQLGLQVAEGLT